MGNNFKITVLNDRKLHPLHLFVANVFRKYNLWMAQKEECRHREQWCMQLPCETQEALCITTSTEGSTKQVED